MRYSVPNDVGLSRPLNSSFDFHGAALALDLRFAGCAGHQVGALEIDFCGAAAVLIFHGARRAADDVYAVSRRLIVIRRNLWFGPARMSMRPNTARTAKNAAELFTVSLLEVTVRPQYQGLRRCEYCALLLVLRKYPK